MAISITLLEFMPQWHVWFVAARPRTLAPSTSPILLTTLLAWQQRSVSISLTVIMLIASIWTHARCIFTNDDDSKRGVNDVQTIGPGGVLQTRLLSRTDLLEAIAWLIGLSVMISIAIQPSYWPILIGLAVILRAIGIYNLLKRCRTVKEYNIAVPKSSQLHLISGLLLCAGLVPMKLLPS